jgi:hypothetical protein
MSLRNSSKNQPTRVIECFLLAIRRPFLFLNFTANHFALFHLPLSVKHGRSSHKFPWNLMILGWSYQRYFFINRLATAPNSRGPFRSNPPPPCANSVTRDTEGRLPEALFPQQNISRTRPTFPQRRNRPVDPCVSLTSAINLCSGYINIGSSPCSGI